MRFQFLRVSILCLVLVVFTACEKGNQNNQNPGETNISIPSAIANKQIALEFTTENSGAPYSLGDQVAFTFSSTGSMAIDVDPLEGNGNEVTISSFTYLDEEFIWEDKDNNHKYALSLQADSTVNEINVYDLSDKFLGQFTPISSSGTNDPLDIIKSLGGTYNVTAVNRGTHTRMSVIIDVFSGSIDFDDTSYLSVVDYELITDRLDDLDGIWIDLAPYPTEPHQRIEMFMKSGTQELASINYYPQYPSINGQVQVAVE